MADARYRAHEMLVMPARARPAFRRLLLGLALVGLVVLGLNTALRAALVALMPGFWRANFSDPQIQGATPAAMLILLGSFAFLAFGTGLAVRWLHDRAPATILGPAPRLRQQAFRVAGALLAVGAILLVLPPYDMGGDLRPNLPFTAWLALLPLSLAAVLLQTGAEEFLFRGYIQQQLAARFSSPWVWMVLPSVLFGLGHYLPAQAGDNAAAIALWSGVFALLMADLTARAGTLAPAIMVHMANNVSALLFIALPDGLSGLALFTVPYEMSDAGQIRAWLPVDFAQILVFWLAARLAIRR
jgi:CAAX protease family protein